MGRVLLPLTNETNLGCWSVAEFRRPDLKITDVKTLVLEYPLSKPVEMSFGKMFSRINTLIEVETDGGVFGLGETWTNFPPWAADERVLTVEKGLKPILIGEDPLNISALWEKMYHALMNSHGGKQWGARGPIMQAISGVDIALWDIMGQQLDVPIYRLLGGQVATKIPAYASGLGPQNYEDYVEASLKTGFSAFKLKVGFGLDSDLNNIKMMRTLIGESSILAIDANQRWRDASEALSHLRHYVDFNIHFIEEPVPADQLLDLKRVRQSGMASVAGGENTYGRHGFKDVLVNEALNILQPDISKTGGFSECYPICRIADAWGLGYAPHMFGTAVGEAASLHVLASIPHGLFMEVDANPNPLRTDLLSSSSFRFEDGSFLLTSDRPGLGITLNMEVVKEYQRRPR